MPTDNDQAESVDSVEADVDFEVEVPGGFRTKIKGGLKATGEKTAQATKVALFYTAVLLIGLLAASMIVSSYLKNIASIRRGKNSKLEDYERPEYYDSELSEIEVEERD